MTGQKAAPILVVGPVRAWAYIGSQVFELPVKSAVDPASVALLASLEAGFSRPLDVSEIPEVNAFDRSRVAFLVEEAGRAGTLRVHSLIPECPPLEWSRGEGFRWADRFTVQRMHAFTRTTAFPGVTAGDNQRELRKKRVLVFANSLGEPPLSFLSEEAEHVFNTLAASSDLEVDFLNRPLSRTELEGYPDAYDAIFYHGHGRLIDDATVVPVKEGWAPLCAGKEGGLLFFSACLEGGAAFVPRRTGHVVHPVVRLSDRIAPFTQAFAEGFAAAPGTVGDRVLPAMRRGAAADREAGDLRRFVFRLASA